MQNSAELPIACTLGQGDLAQRLAWIRQITERNLVSHQLDAATLRLTYRLDALHDLQQVVAKERECCSFLKFALDVSPDAVKLTIQAPPDAASQARWLFDQFLPQQRVTRATTGCGCAPGACG